MNNCPVCSSWRPSKRRKTLCTRCWNTGEYYSEDDAVEVGHRDGTPPNPQSGEEFAATVGTDWWLVEPDVGRVADGVPSRVDRLRGLGNAVVPQIVELIGRAIMNREAA